MKISVVGASGGVGSKLVKEALSSKSVSIHKVLTRKRSKLESAVGSLDGVGEVIEGDMMDPTIVSRMVTDVDVVVSCLGTTGGAKNLIVEKSITSLLLAMKGSKTKLIFISSIGIGDSLAQGKKMAPIFSYIIKPCFLSKVFKDLDDAEEVAFNQTHTPVIAVRPPGLKDKSPTHSVSFLDASDMSKKSAEISRHDVAIAMLSLLEEEEFEKWAGKGVSVVER